MVWKRSDNNGGKRLLPQHVGPVALLIATSGGLLFHILRHPFAIGMANTDTEGTLWWIWSRCDGRINGDVATGIAAPYGFDMSRFATFNIVDEARILVSQLTNCDTDATLLIVSLFPFVALTLLLIATYALGWVVTSSRSLSLVLALCGGVGSQILLATRTPLANNLLAPGIFALLFFLRFKQTSRLMNLLAAYVMVSVQLLSNAYNGMAFLIVLFVFIVTFGVASHSPASVLTELSGLAVSAIVGLFPLLRTQWFLLNDLTARAIYRPVDVSGEVISPLILVSRSHSWFVNLVPDTLPTPEAGWISAPLLIAWLISCRYMFRERLNTERSRLAAASSFSAILISIIVFEIPGTGLVRSAYFGLLSPLRGVNNYAKVLPLLLALSVVAMSKETLEKYSRASRVTRRTVSIGVIAVVFLNVIDSIPTSSTFRERNSLASVKDFYARFEDLNAGNTAHYPVMMYEREWGLPLRFIQLAQMYTGEPVANGRTFDQLQDPCTRLPNPSNAHAYNFLVSRGVSRVVLHRQLMDPTAFKDSTQFLTKEGLRSVSLSSSDLSFEKDLDKALDVVVYEFPQREERSVCGSTHR